MTQIVHTLSRDLRTQLAEHRPQIRRHLLAMVHDAETAEDLTQETYGRALAQLDSLRDPRAGLAWLYRIATQHGPRSVSPQDAVHRPARRDHDRRGRGRVG